jgi:hypothetical protein
VVVFHFLVFIFILCNDISFPSFVQSAPYLVLKEK